MLLSIMVVAFFYFIFNYFCSINEAFEKIINNLSHFTLFWLGACIFSIDDVNNSLFILATLCVIFNFPRSFWSFINFTLGLPIHSILKDDVMTQAADITKKEFVKNVVDHMSSIGLSRKHQIKKASLTRKLVIKNFIIRYFSSFYLLVKLLNLFVVFFTLLWIPKIYGEDIGFFVFKSIADFANELFVPQHLPSFTFCALKAPEVDIGDISNLETKIYPCILFGKKYVIAEFVMTMMGLILLFIANILNIIRWWYFLSSFNRRRFLQNIMKASFKLDQQDYRESLDYSKLTQSHKVPKRLRKQECFKKIAENIYSFVEYIGSDGALAFRLLDAKEGRMIAGSVAYRLFLEFLKQEE